MSGDDKDDYYNAAPTIQARLGISSSSSEHGGAGGGGGSDSDSDDIHRYRESQQTM